MSNQIDKNTLYIIIEKYHRDGAEFFVPSLRGAVYFEGTFAGEEANHPTEEAAIAWAKSVCAAQIDRANPKATMLVGERGNQYQDPRNSL